MTGEDFELSFWGGGRRVEGRSNGYLVTKEWAVAEPEIYQFAFIFLGTQEN